jgi:hypothetical protein
LRSVIGGCAEPRALLSGRWTIYKEFSIIAAMSEVIIELEVEADLRTDNGDHDKFSHYIHRDQVMDAFVEGKPAVALCGKIWVPTRDGKKFPVCKECKEIFETLDM